MTRALKRAALALPVVLVVIQFIPLDRTNPPVTREVRWDTPVTRRLAQRACFDCHSNATAWPWYSRVAPASFLVVNHVSDGRRRLNFSEWDKPQRETVADVEQSINKGDMPIWNYVIAHPEAKLSPAETMQLINGLRATFLQDPPIPSARRRD